MGFDVTYHPMSASEMEEWFFARLPELRAGEVSRVAYVGARADLDAEVIKKYISVLNQAAGWSDPTAAFESTYGFALAAVQTFFGPYWYTRGSSLTFLAERSPRFERFLTPLPAAEVAGFPQNPSNPRITANWQSGAWVSPQNVRALLDELDADPAAETEFEAAFPGGQAEVVLAALRTAVTDGRGVLEATDVIEPDPLDLAKSSCFGSLRTVDLDGLLLYHREALRQLKEAGVIE